MKRGKGIKLQIIISLLILLVIVTTVAITWAISMKTYKENSTEHYLTSNFAYVEKLSNITEHHLDYMLQNLTAFANLVGDEAVSQKELENWFEPIQDSFNSIFVTDEEGIIQLISPEKIIFDDGSIITKGVKITNEMIEQLGKSRKPFISDPYRSKNGPLITLFSVPMYDEVGNYKGAISGTIHLETDNVLNNILGNHTKDDLTYVYVVDRYGQLIFHPSSERLFENVTKNEVVQKVLKGEEGSQIVVNTQGKEFLASYAYIENVGWGIVSQTATENVYEPVSALFWRIVALTTPFLIIVLFLSGLFVTTITKPINTLANYSQKLMGNSSVKKEELPKIRSYVYEVLQLYGQVSNHLQILSREVSRDGLTNLANRRSFDTSISKWRQEREPFALILIDIDHFKHVNDTYGHLVGDEVLKFLAKEMEDTFGDLGETFRYGGEEFAVLLKGLTEKEVYDLAEEFRMKITSTISPSGKEIRISLGVASSCATDEGVEEIIRRADEALYYSKKTGRNKTSVYDGIIEKNRRMNTEKFLS